MKKLMMLIVILCSLCNAEFLDNTNRNLCGVRNTETTVGIGCDIRENNEQILRALFFMKHTASECEEYIYFKDGTWQHKLWFIDNKRGIVGTILRDEYNVNITKDASKTTVANVKKLCMERYTQYKEAKNRW